MRRSRPNAWHWGPPNHESRVLAGGLGTRLAEETEVRPKPMVEIGAPILWHIMKHYARYGFNEFVWPWGTRRQIKRYFLDYLRRRQDMTMTLQDGRVPRNNDSASPGTYTWSIPATTTLTGGRLASCNP